ncbi:MULTISPECIES: hypothetical protein [unclassified Ensifer]|uniref:hypothetical protein n=1 Tax=unclassified Ensifer TaxID=2633371 RepID=UPI00070BB984|nr:MULTISPECIES: hypothetical protein [unclassified Ensifer]KQW61995.1 hypothetical protein ASD02_21130 [Ensifer sp. Root1252]KQW82103.1 hypothetical protein ASD03_23640 [Ensifer sp. Root127]KRC83149.1 hypothetical protein ASE32_24175 [Ensifer sp. Root231]KRC85022.1 hypothetical protein ASE47_18335 [Ensifer sp. Root258]
MNASVERARLFLHFEQDVVEAAGLVAGRLDQGEQPVTQCVAFAGFCGSIAKEITFSAECVIIAILVDRDAWRRERLGWRDGVGSGAGGKYGRRGSLLPMTSFDLFAHTRRPWPPRWGGFAAGIMLLRKRKAALRPLV